MSVTKAHGVRPDGSFGVVGFRAHCPKCGYLSERREGYYSVQHMMNLHRKACRAAKP